MSPSEERGKWYWVRDEHDNTCRITNPAGTKYEISLSRIGDLDRGLVALLNDAIDGPRGLINMQRKNESLRETLESIADIAHCGGLASLSEAGAITAIRKLTLAHLKSGRSVDQMKMDVLAALRAEGGAK